MIGRVVITAAIIVLQWQEPPYETREPALSVQTCQEAVAAAIAGRGLPLVDTKVRKPALSGQCLETATPEAAGFEPGWNCIKNHGCD